MSAARDRQRENLAKAYDRRYAKADSQFVWALILLLVVLLIAGSWLMYRDPAHLVW